MGSSTLSNSQLAFDACQLMIIIGALQTFGHEFLILDDKK